MRNRKPNYSKEFKEKAVELSYHRENIRELAIELGISADVLYKWRSKYSQKLTVPSIPSKNNNALETENKLLRKLLKDAEMERDILKKAVHIFSRKDGKNTSL